MVKQIIRGLAPTFGLALVFSATGEVPAKPGSNAQTPGNSATVNPGKDIKKALTTPYCGRHQDEAGHQGQQSWKVVRPGMRTTHLKATYALGAIGATIPLRATLTLDKNGGPVPAQMVEFKVDGEVVGEALTNNAGEARVDYKVPNKWGAKKVVARFRGNKKCRAATDDTKVGTVRASTTLNFGGGFVNKGSPARLYGELKRTTDGKGVGGREVAIYVNNHKVTTVLTDAAGSIFYDYTSMYGVGRKINVKAQYLGDTLYNPSAGTDSIPVYPERKTVHIRWGGATGMYGETVTIHGQVTVGMPYPGGQKLAGVPVRMWRENGNIGEATSNHLGVVTVKHTLRSKPSRHRIEAHADVAKELYDLNKYNGKFGAYLTILPATVKLTVTGPPTAHVGDSVAYQVTAKRTTNNQWIEGLSVCSPNAKCEKTDASGRTTIEYRLPSQGGTGPRTVEFYSPADDYHARSTSTINITAKPSVN